jgi:hypothetical protein
MIMKPISETLPDSSDGVTIPASKTEFLAVSYLGRGWVPIPLTPHGKEPLISRKEYQKRLPTAEEVRGWWKRWPDANIGNVTGSVSGLVVIDLDSLEAVRVFFSLCAGAAFLTPMVTTPQKPINSSKEQDYAWQDAAE